MKKKKLKLSLNKQTVVKLQNNTLGKIIGGGTETNTCLPGCVDEQSIVLCEISDPCYNTNPPCHNASGVNCG